MSICCTVYRKKQHTCKQEKKTIHNCIMKYVRQHGEHNNREKIFSVYFYLSNTHYITHPFLIQSTDDGNLGSIRSPAQRAPHAMTGSRTVSLQEATHEIDVLPLVICSYIITYASATKSQELRSENNKPARGIISMYWNRSLDHYGLSLGKYLWARWAPPSSLRLL